MCVCVHVCVVGKMAKDIGMTIRKSIVVSFLPCLVAFLAFHPYVFFHFFVTCFCCFFGRMDRSGCTAAACSDSHTVQMYHYSSKGPTDNCKAILAKMNIQHRKRGGY